MSRSPLATPRAGGGEGPGPADLGQVAESFRASGSRRDTVPAGAQVALRTDNQQLLLGGKPQRTRGVIGGAQAWESILETVCALNYL